MKRLRSPKLPWVVSLSGMLTAICAFGLTGQYGFTWMPRWGFLLGLMVVFVIGDWSSWYLATHDD